MNTITTQNKTKNVPDSLGRVYATGRRKTSIARVWIKAGTGKIKANKKDLKEYFTRISHVNEIVRPFRLLKCEDKFDVFCTLKGGGLSGQAGALVHGISRALDAYNPDYHTALSSNKLLTRDDRMVESKKYGKHKARRSTQFAKR